MYRTYYRDSDGSGMIIFGIVCLIIAAISFFIVLHLIPLYAFFKSMENLGNRKFLKTGAWFCLCLFFAIPILSADYQTDLFGIRGCTEHGCVGWHYDDGKWRLD